MDVFSFRDRVVEDYGQFSRSFTQIKAPDLRDFVDGRYGAGEYWPSPLIQLNPSFVGGGSIGALVVADRESDTWASLQRWPLGQGPRSSRPHCAVWLALPADWQEHPLLRHTAQELGRIGAAQQLEG